MLDEDDDVYAKIRKGNDSFDNSSLNIVPHSPQSV